MPLKKKVFHREKYIIIAGGAIKRTGSTMLLSVSTEMCRQLTFEVIAEAKPEQNKKAKRKKKQNEEMHRRYY